MATTIDTRDFFNSELFSDLTIVVDGAEIYCHKIILSSNSEYFANLLKAMDPPKDGSKSVIRIFDSQEFYVTAVIRYLYTCDYEQPGTRSELLDSELHIGVAELANKYGPVKLEDMAIVRLEKAIERIEDMDTVLITLTFLQDCVASYSHTKLQHIVARLKTKHMSQLVKEPEFALMEDSKDLIKTCLQATSFAHYLGKKYFWRCRVCGKGDLAGFEEGGNLRDEVCCGKSVNLKLCWV